jgi:Na+/proline symporter
VLAHNAPVFVAGFNGATGTLGELTAAGRGQLFAVDRRAFRTDPLRRRRTLRTLSEEFKASTTLVLADNLSEAAIVDAIRRGRTMVQLRGPDDPFVEMKIGDAEVGDMISTPEHVDVRVHVVGGAPGPGAPAEWTLPFHAPSGPDLYVVYSVMIATFLGTMGLPHVVVRFYTNPDGQAARRTTLIVLALLGIFYLLPTLYGALGRVYASDLIAAGRVDAVVLELPNRILGSGGDVLTALLTAGAFAAFLSTSSGLTMSVAGVIGQELARSGRLRRRISSVTALRVAAAACVVVPLALALAIQRIPIATSVTFAFALAASTFCPLLVLGIWWRGLTAPGAVAGLAAGGVGAGLAPLVRTAIDTTATWRIFVDYPAAWSVPLGFGVMIAGSLATRSRVPTRVSRTMVRLHTPEGAHLDRG